MKIASRLAMRSEKESRNGFSSSPFRDFGVARDPNIIVQRALG
jgi:hypothetical protein